MRFRAGLIALALVLALVQTAEARRRKPSKDKSSSEEKVPPDSGLEPLLITPMLEAGDVDKAQNTSRVRPPVGGVESYAGLLTVNKTQNANLFFWLFPAEKGLEAAPLVLWLQGQPGSSAMLGLFLENGPFRLRKGQRLKKRKYSWTRSVSMLYIDSPVGTGYSFTGSEEGYATSEEDVGQNLYEAMRQIFQLFPQLKDTQFFIAGESYAGKYIPALAHVIHISNPTAANKINLKGLAIGNPISEPEAMLDYSEYLYQIGLVDERGRDEFKSRGNQIKELVAAKKWIEACDAMESLIMGRNISSFFVETTGYMFPFNYLHETDYLRKGYKEYVQRPEIRAAIHVGNLTWNEDSQVLTNLRGDAMQSARPWVEELLEHYDVLFYNGQLDLAAPYRMMANFLKSLQWSGAQEYRDAPRKQWMVDGDLAGYSKTAGHLTEVLVRAAGHMVPLDQPKWALELITKFTTEQAP